MRDTVRVNRAKTKPDSNICSAAGRPAVFRFKVQGSARGSSTQHLEPRTSNLEQHAEPGTVNLEPQASPTRKRPAAPSMLDSTSCVRP